MNASLDEVKKALAALERKAAAMRSDHSSPLAVVGVGCRFPGGADSPDAFWDLLVHGRDAVREVPPDRWDGNTGCKWAACIDNVDSFDAAFFGIGAREAEHMDPQHRLVLEVVWDALNTAGIPARSLQGSATGVYIGAYTDDYRLLHMADAESIDAFSGTGTIHSLAANRVSYLLDLRGPSLAVDASCASSLVAVHLACESLRRGECDVAIAGAVNLILSPLSMLSASKVVPMAADGRCKTFSAEADGIVRGEGCGIVILKRLQDAEAARDTIWAVIEGTAVNQDGRSNGMTAPNPAAQEQVLARALASARVSAAEVDYIEAHGTGTPLGDPIEIESLCNVYRHPILVGSVKTNLGHLEAAAGMAGLIKTILAVSKGVIPPHLHFVKWNPAIAGVSNVTIPTRPLDWPAERPTRRAGVSAFSLGGTNAHVIVASPPVQKIEESEDGSTVLLPISAENPAALRELSQSYLHILDRCGSEAEFKDICYTASLRRAHYSERFALLADSKQKTCARLAARLRAESALSSVTKRNSVKRLVFVFPGQGLRWSRAGHELLASEPAFRESMLRSDALVRQMTGWSLIERWREPGALDRADIAQPAILALQLALTGLLETYGIVPSAVIGHSLGEATAACVAGVLCPEDAMRMLLHRGALVEGRAGRGRMAAFEVDAHTAKDLARPFDGRVSIAAFNSPTSVVLSGDCEAIEKICRTADSEGIRYVPLHTNYGFHSPQMRPLTSELRDVLENLVPGRQIRPMYSTVTGRLFEASSDHCAHWIRNLVDPVRFTDAITAALADSYEDFLEIGPAALSRHIRTALGEDARGMTAAVLKKDRNERESLLEALADLYAGRYDLAWESFFPKPRRVSQLPAYPWQRRRYWLAKPNVLPASVGRVAGALLHSERTWTFSDATAPCWHRVGQDVTFSLAGYIGGIAGVLNAESFPIQVENLVLHAPLTISAGMRVTVQTILVPGPTGDFSFTAASRSDASPEWRVYATAAVRLNARLPEIATSSPEAAHIDAGDVDAAVEVLLRLGAVPFVSAHGEVVALSCDSVLLGTPPLNGKLRTGIREMGPGQAAIDIVLLGANGKVAAEIRGLRLRAESKAHPGLYEVVWQHAAATADNAIDDGIYARVRKDIDELCSLHSSEALLRLRDRNRSADVKHEILLSKLEQLAAAKNGSTRNARDLTALLSRQYPELQPELLLLERCAGVLPDVLTGATSALEAIFAIDGSGRSLAEQIYHDSPFAKYWNATVRRAVLSRFESSRSGRMRILEIGAGTGGTTAAILPHLPSDRTEYWFTDLSGALVNRARETFKEFGFVRYCQLDASDPSASREVAGQSFDIIIAANIVHAVASPLETLRALGELTKPDGVLVLLEGTSNRNWADLTFGATEGWFRQNEQIRNNGPLLMPADWIGMLKHAGWRDAIEALRGPGHDAALIIAMRAEAARKPLYIVIGDPALNSTIRPPNVTGCEVIEARDPADLRSVPEEPARIVDCTALQTCATSVEERAADISRHALDLARVLLGTTWKRPPRIWFMTRGVREASTVEALAQSSLHGFARVFFTEHPEFAGGVIDLDADGAGDALAWNAIEANIKEDWLAIRSGALEVARLKPSAPPPQTRRWDLRDGAYLITGGLGGVGLKMAAWLARNGAKHIVLVNRGPHEETGDSVTQLQADGVEILVRTADVSVQEDIAGILAELTARGLPLRGVIHCAGVASDGVIGQQDWPAFDSVLRPKVNGAWNLHVLTRELPLDFFLLFSSACTLVGLSGLAAYTTANAFLDGLAAHRNSLGLPAQVIDWGGWRRTGMADRVGSQREHQWATRGLYTMTPDDAVSAFEQGFQTETSRIAIASINWNEFSSSFARGEAPPLFQHLLSRGTSSLLDDVPFPALTRHPPSFAAMFRAMTPSERAPLFYSFLRGQLANLVAAELPSQLAPDESIVELGLDSLMTVEIRNKLAGAFEISLPVTSLFDYPTPRALLSHIATLSAWDVSNNRERECSLGVGGSR